MLGAEVAQHLVGEVAFEQLGGPLLPTGHQRPKVVHGARLDDPTNQIAGAGWGAAPLVEHRDHDLATGEALIEDRQVRDDDGQKAEPRRGLDYRHEARQVGVRREVPDAQGREARAADVQVAEGGEPYIEVGGPQEERETRDQEDSPEDEEDQQRQRAVDAEEGLAPVARPHPAGDRGPGFPADNVKHLREAHPRNPARKDDRLEGVPQHTDHQEEAEQAHYKQHLVLKTLPSVFPIHGEVPAAGGG